MNVRKRLLLTAVGFTSFPTSLPADDTAFFANVLQVVDGDTIIVEKHEVPITVQINGIDAPEIGQPYGEEAKGKLTALIGPLIVKIFPEAHVVDGAIIANVHAFALGTHKEIDVSTEMVKSGMAWQSQDTTDFTFLQIQAENAGVGLWPKDWQTTKDIPLPPWDWRKDVMQGKRPPHTDKPQSGSYWQWIPFLQ